MKAAIFRSPGQAPVYEDYPDPVAQRADQLVIKVKAAAVKNLDRGQANGSHYSSGPGAGEARVLGQDGVGILSDGTRVYAAGLTGMFAELALVEKDKLVNIPARLDSVTAAALPNAVLGSVLGLLFRAELQPGETVLINGGTGVTGAVAVQIARHYGAKKVIVTGRNKASLEKLRNSGADEIISLTQEEEAIRQQLKELHTRSPIDIVLDYLWGRPAEMILSAMKGKGGHTHPVRYVTLGAMAGDEITLSSSILRSADIKILGSGFGSVPKKFMSQLFTRILPETMQLAADGKLKIETITAPLKDIGTAWNKEIPAGKRLVLLT